MNATRTPAEWTVGRNQDLAAGELGGEIGYFECDVGDVTDEIRDRGVRLETHPLHAKFAFVVADDEEFQVLHVRLARLRFGRGNADVMVPAHLKGARRPWRRRVCEVAGLR